MRTRKLAIGAPARRAKNGLLLVALGVSTLSCGKPKPTTVPPPVVGDGVVEQRDIIVNEDHAGTLEARVTAEARARVEGFIISQNYVEGTYVKAGQLLFVIDPQPFEAAKLQAEGNLAAAKAALLKASTDVERDRPLVAKQAVSQQDLDHAIADRDSAEGQVAATQGALRTAQLNLGYTRVLAPVDGIAGIAQIRLGNLVGAGTPTLLTTVYDIDPIRLDVPLSEREYIRFAEAIERFERSAAMGGTPEGPGAVQLILADGSVLPHLGHIAIVGGQIDPTTGTIPVQALFPNPNHLLRPGQYGLLRIKHELKQAVVIPQRAVTQLLGQSRVATLGPGNKVEVHQVKLGQQSGSFVVVESGLSPGERIVVEGVDKVREGETVAARPADTSELPLTQAQVEAPRPPVPAGDAAAPPAQPAGRADGSTPGGAAEPPRR